MRLSFITHIEQNVKEEDGFGKMADDGQERIRQDGKGFPWIVR